MQHVRSLNSAFHLDNLNRAWNWLLTNPEAPYKNYFRHVYAAYSLSTNDNLRCLSSKLKDGTYVCLLYTSDAADDLLCVDLGGRRIIKKKKHNKQEKTT